MKLECVLVIYGLPCTGKSGLVNLLTSYYPIAIDSYIKDRVSEPEISDFQRLSKELVDDVINDLLSHNGSNIVIEMGCLISKEGIEHLESFLKKNNVRFSNIILTADKNELISRIKTRNIEVDLDKSNAIKVDGPDYLTRFVDVFELSQPKQSITIDTSKNTLLDIIKKINTYQKDNSSIKEP